MNVGPIVDYLFAAAAAVFDCISIGDFGYF